MKYRYRYIDEIVDQIEGLNDPAHKMAVIWANQDQQQMKVLCQLIYDYRYSFEIASLPKYSRKRAAGVDFHTAVALLDKKLNTRVIGASSKFAFAVDILQMLQDRDADVLERALRGQIDFGIPLEDIQRVYPMIQASPNMADDAENLDVLSDQAFPATVIRQIPGPEVRVEIGQGDSFKFVDSRGRGLVLPDKPNSNFRSLFKPFNNVVLCANFQGLTKDLTKVGNTATTNSVFAKFQAGELDVEQISITILDVVDRTSYLSYPRGRPDINMTFAQRRDWLMNQDWGDTIFVKVADSTELRGLEDLRQLENEVAETKDTLRIYDNSAIWNSGFKVLNKSAF